ncbi:MAG: alpha-amylase family glycosyl hydrolase [Syntrophomonadaceae bacterium]|nr:alpha-amylase family glycosyl hydrolase [Syntrophomonadaceae bacterium]
MIASARHNSRLEYYRHPFGAVAAGGAVRLRLEILSEFEAQCFLHLRSREGGEQLLPMELIDRISAQGLGHRLYECTVTLPAQPGLMWYDFEIDHRDKYYYYGCAEGSGGEGRLSTVPLHGFQITVYHPSPVPAWFKQALVYQIFPDRFFRSLPAGHYRPAGSRRILHADWNDVPFYNRDESGAIERWDFFGGDLRGIIDKLPYLEQLGVDAIYLNPVFQAASNHRYDTGDYHRIDPVLGDEDDLRLLCQKAGKLGIRIILDGVFAHSGDDSVYFNRYGNYPTLGAYQSRGSHYYNWYSFEQWPETYKCWWGVKSLPRLDCTQDSYRDFIYRRPDSVLRHWMGCGVSGWRLDVADELPDAFALVR